MNRLFFAFGILFITVCANAQTSIKLEEVDQHIGDSVRFCGKVADMRYFENSKNQPTFLNMGAKYPNQQITLVIWGDTRKLFTGQVENLLNKDICVTGRIILYKQKPEIIIEKTEQITLQ